MPIVRSVRGYIYLVPLIPSIIIAVFNLYYLLTVRALRTALNNHVIILLLCSGLIEALTDIVWQIYFDRNNVVLSSTPAFCLAWIFLGATTYIQVFILMAWASMERHVLVFYPNWFGTKTRRLCFHYIPLAVCILYPATFYLVTFIILPCDYPFRYTANQCGRYNCILVSPRISLWDSIAHYILPPFITAIFSVALFARVLYRRYRARGQIDWRNYRKMTAQLLPIFIISVTMQLPPMILYAAYAAGVPYSFGSVYYNDGVYFTYWAVLLTPFATIASLPDLKTKCRKLLFWRRNHAVRPVAIETARRNVNKPAATEVPRSINNQPVATETAHQNVNQPAAIEVTHQNTHQPLGITMTTRYLDQPVAVLPDVQ